MNRITRVTELRCLESIEDITLAWQALLGDTRSPSYFQSHEWFLTYCRNHQAEPRVLRVDVPGQLLGIVPLVLRRRRMPWGVVRVLAYPLPEWATTMGPVGANPTAALLATFRFLRQQPTDWDVLDLAGINRSEVDHGRTLCALRQAGFPARESSHRRFDRLSVADALAAAEPSLAMDSQWQHAVFAPERHADFSREDFRWLAIARDLASPDSALNVCENRLAKSLHQAASCHGRVQVHVWFDGEQTVACGYYLRMQNQLVELARGINSQMAMHPPDWADAVLTEVMRSNRGYDSIILDRWAVGPTTLPTHSLMTHRYSYARRGSPGAQLWRLGDLLETRWLTSRAVSAAR